MAYHRDDLRRRVADELGSGQLVLYTSFGAPHVLERLNVLADLQARLRVAQRHTVARARALEISWARIGEASGMSGQAAWQRWQHLERRSAAAAQVPDED